MPIGEPDVVRCIERIGRDFPELALALVHPRPTAEMFALCDSFEGLAFVFDSDALARAASSGILKGNSYVERCMWGSDGAPLGESVAAALNAELSEAAKVEVLRGNALRYFATSIIDRLPQALSREVTVAE